MNRRGDFTMEVIILLAILILMYKLGYMESIWNDYIVRFWNWVVNFKVGA